MTKGLFVLVPAGFVLASTGWVGAATYSFDALFNTAIRQSAWAPGDAARIADKVFVGPSLNYRKEIVGNGSKAITNPAYAPAVALGCKLIKTCPSPTITRTGIGSIDVESKGRIGLEFGYSVDAGSVGATVDYGVGADIPDVVRVGQAVNLNTRANLNAGSLDAFSPNIRADIDQITKLAVDVNIKTDIQKANILGTRELENITKRLVDVDERISLVDADLGSIKWLKGLTDRVTKPNGDPLLALETPLLNQEITWDSDLPTKSLAYKIGDGAFKRFYDPTGNLPGLSTELGRFGFTFPTAEERTDEIKHGGLVLNQRSNFLEATLDMDGIVGHALSTPFGVTASLGKHASLSGDLLDAEASVGIDVFQNLELFPRLDAALAFSSAVEINGQMTNTWAGNWLNLPEIIFFQDTEVTPVFDLYNTFKSTTGLTFDVNAQLDLVKLGASLKIYDKDILKGSFGPLYRTNASKDFASLDIYTNSFRLQGFAPVLGNSFRVDVIDDPTTAPPVPLPAGLTLMLSALGAGAFLTHRRRRRVTA